MIGQIKYTYSGRSVGYANLVFTSAETGSYPFDNLPVEKGGSGKQYIQVDYFRIGLGILIVLIVVAIVLFIRSKSSDILLFRHRFMDKHPRKNKSNMTIIRENGKRRRHKRK